MEMRRAFIKIKSQVPPSARMTAEDSKAVYACISYGEGVCQKKIARRSIVINADIGEVLFCGMPCTLGIYIL